MSVEVDLIVEATGWSEELPELEAIATEAAGMAAGAAGLDGDATVAVLACDDQTIAGLNLRFRGKDGPTNVLSWPAEELAADQPGGRPRLPEPSPGDEPLFLGDLAIAFETCLGEAETARIPLKNHVRHLILHGCLHLLGYDHETAEDADLMEGIESRVLRDAGYLDPYA